MNTIGMATRTGLPGPINISPKRKVLFSLLPIYFSSSKKQMPCLQPTWSSTMTMLTRVSTWLTL